MQMIRDRLVETKTNIEVHPIPLPCLREPEGVCEGLIDRIFKTKLSNLEETTTGFLISKFSELFRYMTSKKKNPNTLDKLHQNSSYEGHWRKQRL